MQKKYILPVAGQIYKNRNGREYCCLSDTSYPRQEAMWRAVNLGEHQAAMVRMSDGWSFTAHGLHQYEDGLWSGTIPLAELSGRTSWTSAAKCFFGKIRP